MRNRKVIVTTLLLVPTMLWAQQKSFPKAVNRSGADSVQIARELEVYMEELGRLEQRNDSLRLLAATKMFESGMNEDTMALYEGQAAHAFAELIDGQHQFARRHPKMLIASDLCRRLLDGTDPTMGFFRFTADELRELRLLGMQCADTARQNAVAQKYTVASRYAKGMDYLDVELTDTVGRAVRLSDFVERGKPCLLDFWASWCGPCKRAIPQVRQLWQRYGGQFSVVSISTDEKQAAWRKAMSEQVMPWPQLWTGSKTQQAEAARAYAVQTLPHLVLIDAEGHVALVTYSEKAVEDWLAQRLQPATFSLDCVLPGMKAGTEVTLKSMEQLPRGLKQPFTVKAKALTDGRVTLTAPITSPTLCQLSVGQKAVTLMAEPWHMVLKAEHVDSLPGFMRFPIDHDRALRVSIEGGLGQQEYRAYETSLAAAERNASVAWAEWVQALEGKAEKEEQQRLQQQMEAAEKLVKKAQSAYVGSHPMTTVAGMLLAQQLSQPFVYTSVQLDSVARVVSRMWDPARRAVLDTLLAQARAHTSNQPYTDFALCTTQGAADVKHLSDYRTPGRYTLVDFWASWCGPCRQSIPKVRDLWQQRRNQVDVLSISVDRDEAAWRKAMEQERMEWTQLWMTVEQMPAVRTAYQLQSIPYLLLIAPTGDVVYAGHSVAEASEVLDRHATVGK